jgi:hypothetical protein
MIGKTANALAPSALPTLADLRQRTAELLEIQSQLQAQSPEPDLDPPSRSDQAPRSSLAPPQRPTNPACPACPGTPRSEPWVLGEAALYGLAGLAVRTIAPHTEAHPAAILLQLLACPCRVGLLLRQRLPPLRRLHRGRHRRSYPRGPRGIPSGIIEVSDPSPVPRSRQLRPHRRCSRTTNADRRSRLPQRANPRPLLHPLVGHRAATDRRKRNIGRRFRRVRGRRGGGLIALIALLALIYLAKVPWG